MAREKETPTISFTYNDPISFYEYAYDIAKLAQEKGVRILWHSNGTFNPEPLQELLQYTDAVTIDLKGFTEEFYENASGASLEPCLKSLKIIREKGVWLEVVNLMIPGLNDKPKTINQMCRWIKENLGEDTPLHFSRFFPNYRLTSLAPTPIKWLDAARDMAKKAGLKYVTVGNVPGHEHNSTFCPGCGKAAIRRTHFEVEQINLKDGKCRFCGYSIPGIWE
jgi:pyruvate formate lyase activating enzyme